MIEIALAGLCLLLGGWFGYRMGFEDGKTETRLKQAKPLRRVK